MHTHTTQAGNIYFTYASQNPTSPSARAVVKFAADGTNAQVLGNSTLALGVPHGIKVQMEADGKEYVDTLRGALPQCFSASLPVACCQGSVHRRNPCMVTAGDNLP